MHFEKLVKGMKQCVHSQQWWICPHPFPTNDINVSLYNMYEKTSKESLLAAVNNLKKDGNVSTDENLDTDIGIDGSWQKWGYSSLNGVVTGVTTESKKSNKL